MTTRSRPITIYIDEALYKALKLKAVENSKSMSILVNDAVRESLIEDAVDLLAFDERSKESLISYDDLIKRLKK